MKKILFACLLLLFAGCLSPGPKSVATWSIRGSDALATSAPPGDITAAIMQVHDKLGAWAQQADGSKSDNSFQSSSQGYSSNGPQRLSRNFTQFNDAAGVPMEFEIIENSGSETLIFVSYKGKGGPLAVLNVLTQSLMAQGVAMAKS